MASTSPAHETPTEGTLESLGEFSMIEKLQEIALLGAKNLQSPVPSVDSGDDAAIVSFGNADVAVSVDMFIENRHFRTDWSTGVDIGRRCAAAAMSDICAMGLTPSTLVVGLAVPNHTTTSFLKELFSGLVEEASIAGARVVGGDLSAADVVMVSVTAFGPALKDQPLKRSGACAGDVVAIHGSMGRAAAGLRILQRGLRSPRSLVDSYRFPHMDYTAGVRAREAGAHSMIDISDGLTADLRHLARASNVTINIDSGKLPIPEDLQSTASAFGVDPLSWMLTGGDDHALVATFPLETPLPLGFIAIGEVLEAAPEAVTVDHSPAPLVGGFSHFGGST